MFKFITEPLFQWLTDIGLSVKEAQIITDFSGMVNMLVISILSFFIAHSILYRIIRKITKKTKTKWDDYLIDNKFFRRLAFLVPGYIMYSTTPYVLANYTEFISFFQSFVSIYMVFIVLLAISSVINASADIYNDYPVSKVRPIKGYLQTAKIILYFIGAIVIFSFLFNKNPLGLLGGLGAFTAVLLLVFKDPLLGFVAGIQLSSNNMLIPGDWIVMPKYDVDGVVTDISLTTIKVQNWDKTISTVPSYSLISESFKNWRGMHEAGGRRIKKSVMIDINTIRFLDADILAGLRSHKKIDDLMNLCNEIKSVVQLSENDSDPNHSVTNLTLFRLYLKQYLNENPNISKEFPFFIRYLEPGEKGLPLEIYAFCNQIEWIRYEEIQAQIIDHIFSTIRYFRLQVFQSPSGTDWSGLK